MPPDRMPASRRLSSGESKRVKLPEETPENPTERLAEVDISDDVTVRLDDLTAGGWAVEWRSGEAAVMCYLILFSSRRVQGRGKDAEAAGRDALRKIDDD